MIRADGARHRFAFVRDGQVPASKAFRRAPAAAGVGADTPATVLCDGDAGLWQLQREVLPNATPVLDWWPAVVRLEHALHGRPRPRSRHGRGACRRHGGPRLGTGEVAPVARGLAGAPAQARRPVPLGYLGRNEAALAPYAARRRCGEATATSFVESAVDEIIAWRMAKKQQMRWNRAAAQPVLDVRTAVLNNTLEDAFRSRHPGFRPANDDRRPTAAA